MVVRPIQVDVVGVHPRWSRLLVVQIRLDPRPPRRWRDLFAQAGTAFPAQPMHDPAIDGGVVTITPPDDGFEMEVSHVEARIRIANERYAAELEDSRSVTAPVSAQIQPPEHETDNAASTDNVMRIEMARRKARGLSAIFNSSQWQAEDFGPVAVTPRRPQSDDGQVDSDAEIDF
jgi:hypothetical protein